MNLLLKVLKYGLFILIIAPIAVGIVLYSLIKCLDYFNIIDFGLDQGGWGMVAIGIFPIVCLLVQIGLSLWIFVVKK